MARRDPLSSGAGSWSTASVGKRQTPSGLPSDRIIGQIYGPPERDMDSDVANRYAGSLRARRALFVVSVAVGVLAAAVAIFGSSSSASGIVALLLAPLLVILFVVHIVALVSAPKEPHVELTRFR